jgi:hypothetical protein
LFLICTVTLTKSFFKNNNLAMHKHHDFFKMSNEWIKLFKLMAVDKIIRHVVSPW